MNEKIIIESKNMIRISYPIGKTRLLDWYFKVEKVIFTSGLLKNEEPHDYYYNNYENSAFWFFYNYYYYHELLMLAAHHGGNVVVVFKSVCDLSSNYY